MSVKQCSRANCENIMCDRYSSNYGYICEECFSELQTSCNANIQQFLHTPSFRSGAFYKMWINAINEEFKGDS